MLYFYLVHRDLCFGMHASTTSESNPWVLKAIQRGGPKLSSHPVNLIIRFLLEVAALVAIGFWGWKQDVVAARILLAVGLPLLAAVLWGTFAVPEDPSRSGRAPVPVPGKVRLTLELVFFGIATWMLWDVGNHNLAIVLGLTTAVHYMVSFDRIQWLVKR